MLCDLNGNQRSELPGALNRSYTTAVGSMGTGAFTVRQDHPDADFLLDCAALVKVYEDDPTIWDEPQLRMHGRLVSAEEAASDGKGSIACTFADGFWALTHRLIGKSNTGYSKFDAATPGDAGAIITDILSVLNTEHPTGLVMGTVGASMNTYLANVRYTKASDQIAALGATLDGPDWIVDPIEYDTGNIGSLRVAGSISTVQPDAVFEYGDGRLNVASYQRAVTIDTCANRVFNLPPGFPDNATQEVLESQNTISQAANGLLEDMVASDLTVDDLRQKLLDHHIAVRANPRQTITFTPIRDVAPDKVPKLGRDYRVGDVVPFRVSQLNNGEVDRRIDVTVRVYQVAMAIDDGGYGTPTLTVTPS